MEYSYWDANIKEWVVAPTPEEIEKAIVDIRNNLVSETTDLDFYLDEDNEEDYEDNESVGYDVGINTNKDNLLPFGTRYTEQRGRDVYYLIEVKPRIVTFNYSHYDYIDISNSNDKVEFEVAVPWEYYWLHFRKPPENDYGISIQFINSQLLWAQERMVSLDSLVYAAKLPNTGRSPDDYYYTHYGAGHMCLGSAVYHLTDGKSGTSLAEISESLVEHFYDAKFNDNMNNGYPYPFGDANIWAEESAKDPYGWMKWDDLVNEPKDSLRNLIRYEV